MQPDSAAAAPASVAVHQTPPPRSALDEELKGQYYGNARPEVFSYLPLQVGRLLDVGCGHGAFGALVKERLHAEVQGIELYPEVAQVAAGRLDRVHCGDALTMLAQTPLAYFDCVTFNDVLEHLVDPAALLRAVRQHLSPGGVVVASLPNVRHYAVLADLLLRGDWDYADYGVLDRTHLRFFTHKSIRKLFAETGYELTRMEGINGPTSRRGRVLSRLLPTPLQDIQYLQFVCVARPR